MKDGEMKLERREINLFIDDVRMPSECALYMHRRIGKLNTMYINEDWIICRDFFQFVRALKKNDLSKIKTVSFDHDLADIHYDPSSDTESFAYNEKDGYDCGFVMKQMFEQKGIPLPQIFIHSMNPVGAERIAHLFKNKT